MICHIFNLFCSVWNEMLKVSTELVHQGHMEAGKFHLGTTKIFLRTSTQRTLDAAREAHVRMTCVQGLPHRAR